MLKAPNHSPIIDHRHYVQCRRLRVSLRSTLALYLIVSFRLYSQDRFYDLAELSILSEKSVENLNELICDPSTDVSYRNFRPSILLDVNMPFEEDYWAVMKIGDLETEFLQRCVRCVLITINPDTGVKTDKEPLTTLRKYVKPF